MESAIKLVYDLFFSGLSNLTAYLAAHVLLCLLPAFVIAGAMTALIPKETVTRYLGRNTPNTSLIRRRLRQVSCWLFAPAR